MHKFVHPGEDVYLTDPPGNTAVKCYSLGQSGGGSVCKIKLRFTAQFNGTAPVQFQYECDCSISGKGLYAGFLKISNCMPGAPEC